MKTKMILMLSLFLFIGIFQSCKKNDTQLEFEEQTYDHVFTDEDGKQIKVSLSDDLTHNYRSFSSEEELGIEQDKITATGAVTISKTLHQKLKHFCDPVEISLLDEEGKFEVNGKVYQYTKEALYEWNVGEESSKEMTFFYGEKGDEDLKEVTFIMANKDNPEILNATTFKNRKLAVELINNPTRTTVYKYSQTITLYNIRSEEGSHSTVQFKAYCWNRGYRVAPRKFRSSGGVTMMARKGSGSWKNLHSGNWFKKPNGASLGLPYLRAEINGGNGIGIVYTFSNWANSVVAGRKKNHGVFSRHWARYKRNSHSNQSYFYNYYMANALTIQ